MFIRIAVIEPANVAETYIVASTVIACTGSNVNVKGNSKAAPVVAPRPGNTPRITPNTVVIKIKNIRYGSKNTDPIAVRASIIINSHHP